MLDDFDAGEQVEGARTQLGSEILVEIAEDQWCGAEKAAIGPLESGHVVSSTEKPVGPRSAAGAQIQSASWWRAYADQRGEHHRVQPRACPFCQICSHCRPPGRRRPRRAIR